MAPRTEVTVGSDRAEASREHLLEVAVQCLVDVGYASTTTVAVQERAEVSRGGLLHHFPTKEKLLVDAARHLVEMRLSALDSAATESSKLAIGPGRIDVAIELIWRNFTESHFDASLELWTAARTNAALRRALLPQERDNRRLQLRIAAHLFGSYADHPRYTEMLDLLMTSMRGAALLRVLDGDGFRTGRVLDTWKRIAHEMLGTAAASSSSRDPHDGGAEQDTEWELDDETWAAVRPMLSEAGGRRGGQWTDHRLIVEAILWKERTGRPWRDIPGRFGPWKTVWKRHARWREDGTLARIHDVLR